MRRELRVYKGLFASESQRTHILKLGVGPDGRRPNENGDRHDYHGEEPHRDEVVRDEQDEAGAHEPTEDLDGLPCAKEVDAGGSH